MVMMAILKETLTVVVVVVVVLVVAVVVVVLVVVVVVVIVIVSFHCFCLFRCKAVYNNSLWRPVACQCCKAKRNGKHVRLL